MNEIVTFYIIFLYIHFIKVIDISTGEKHLEDILPVDIVDFIILRKDWYFFDWKMEKNQ
jgi:hypothetical protein